MPRSLKVLYILGFARSGTTILGNLLGELDGFFHMGELHSLWPRLFAVRRNKCGCERPLRECAFWTAVLDRMAAGVQADSGDNGSAEKRRSTLGSRALQLQERANRSESVWSLLFRSMPRDPTMVREYLNLKGHLLEAVSRESGAHVLVDSSKLPRPARWLAHVPSAEVYYLHLVRDPRGCVVSRQRRHAKREGGVLHLNPGTTIADSARWMRTNWMAERIRSRHRDRNLRLTYEDFVTGPESALRKILELVDESPPSLPFLDSHTARIGGNHTVCGNRNRFQSGQVHLQFDDRWLHVLRDRDRRLISSLTAPLLLRYGYSLVRGEPRFTEEKTERT